MTAFMNTEKEENKTGAVYKKTFYSRHGKRLLDVLLSGFALIILSPLLLILALLVRIFHGSPILFSPTRPGLNERIFPIYKFRTMSNAKNSDGKLLPEKDRLTKFGRFLRASSLDELPELFNILFGDMSIVGPRPLAKAYLEYYTKEQRPRHSVRPGLTGLAQINGRNNLPWDQRIEKDLEYIQNLSFGLDLKIIVETILKVIKHKDITIPGGKKLDLAAHNLIKEEGEVHYMNKNTTWSEIGSHFWEEETNQTRGGNKNNWFSAAEDGAFTFSGRAAIALALNDAKMTKRIATAYIPSYCCLSMLQPFIDLGIKYEFYDVCFDGNKITYQLDENKHFDLLLIMKYFGTEVDNYNSIIEKMKKKGTVIIEDITHTVLNENPGSNEADYCVASLRKWFPIPAGGIILKNAGKLNIKPDMDSNHAADVKIEAMQEKFEYITGKSRNKDSYLQKFSTFEQDLIQLNIFLKIDDKSLRVLENVDINETKKRRKENASILYNRLKDVTGLQFLNPGYDSQNETPLFVPVMLPDEKRDKLRKYLISKGVYCPVHWPEVMGAKPGIRENELSLICDQRYGANDMHYMADLISDWCKANMTDR